MAKNQFVGSVMKESGGQFNPKSIAIIYHDLMKDAGLKPLI